MADLLIHSLAELAPLILPALELAGTRDIAEIGAEAGGMSRLLAAHCATHGGTLTSIDPAPSPEFLAFAQATDNLRHIAEPSLTAIPTLGKIDAWVIDGDHNYYTVSRELALIDAAACRAATPLLAFLHDVGWPWGRRDLYYDPAQIPLAHRHPHSFTAGVTLGDAEAADNRGFRGAGHWACARTAGGPANGVLTAVEDFLAAASTPARRLAYVHVPAVFGLGVIYDVAAPWAPALAAQLAPWHDHPLLATLEVNRLRNYLAVIDWQDRHAEALAASA